MGTPRWRVFRTVTLPGVRYGLISAAFVVFTLVVTDFGIAKVIGGQFNVLATDAYKQVIGQQNFEMGAVVGFVLLVPAVLAFALDRQMQRRQVALLSARAVPLEPQAQSRSRMPGLPLYCLAVGGLIAARARRAVWASFVTYWPYNLTLTPQELQFRGLRARTASAPYFASLQMAALAAVLGTAIVFSGAYLIEKGQGFRAGRALAHLLAMLPMAVPGLVLGLGYVFFINARWNPLGVLYGTILLLAINSIAHFYTTAHVTARDGAEADRQRVRGRVGVAEGAVLPHVRARHGADLHAGDPRHRRLYVRQCADHGVGRDLSSTAPPTSWPRSRWCTWTRPAPRPPRRPWRR